MLDGKCAVKKLQNRKLSHLKWANDVIMFSLGSASHWLLVSFMVAVVAVCINRDIAVKSGQ